MDVWILRALNYTYYPLFWFWLLRVQKQVYSRVRRKIKDEPYPVEGDQCVHLLIDLLNRNS